MGSYKEILITPHDLKYSNILEKRIILKKENAVLLQGQVLNNQNKPIKNALILISELNISIFPTQIVSTAYLFTNKNGEYATVLKADKYIDYKLEIFEPLIYVH